MCVFLYKIWVFFRLIDTENIFSLSLFCCSSTVVYIFPPLLTPTAAIPTSHPRSYPSLALSMGPLYMFLDGPFFFFPHYPLPPPLWLLSVCSVFKCLWLYFACLLVLLIRLQLKVRSYGICPSLLAYFT